MADFTNIDFRENGVNQDTNFTKQYAFTIDAAANSAMLATGTHDLAVIPAGEAVTAVKVFVLTGAASSGAATVQFKLDFGGTAEAVNSTAGDIANLAAGDIAAMPVSGIKAFDTEAECVLQMAVGTAALTAFKFLLVVETVPVKEFITRG